MRNETLIQRLTQIAFLGALLLWLALVQRSAHGVERAEDITVRPAQAAELTMVRTAASAQNLSRALHRLTRVGENAGCTARR